MKSGGEERRDNTKRQSRATSPGPSLGDSNKAPQCAACKRRLRPQADCSNRVGGQVINPAADTGRSDGISVSSGCERLSAAGPNLYDGIVSLSQG